MTGSPVARIAVALIGTAAMAASLQPAQAANDGDSDATQLTVDGAGILGSISTSGFRTGSTNGFFANLGTNGRTCGTCHLEADAWTFTPQHAR